MIEGPKGPAGPIIIVGTETDDPRDLKTGNVGHTALEGWSLALPDGAGGQVVFDFDMARSRVGMVDTRLSMDLSFLGAQLEGSETLSEVEELRIEFVPEDEVPPMVLLLRRQVGPDGRPELLWTVDGRAMDTYTGAHERFGLPLELGRLGQLRSAPSLQARTAAGKPFVPAAKAEMRFGEETESSLPAIPATRSDSDWLRYAPSAPVLKSDAQWHVFLSYHSRRRPWALQLRDVLSSLGYRVFVDQFEVRPGDSLPLAIGDAIQGSAAGLLVRSPLEADSRWCGLEYSALHARKQKDDDFSLVVVKLGRGEVPALAEGDVVVGFDDDGVAPHGTKLLQLLWALQGKPLPDEAVRFAVGVDEMTRRWQAEASTLAESGDSERLSALARTDHVAWTATPSLSCSVARSLISMGAYKPAIELLEDIEQQFPRALRPQQLLALAYARAGKREPAELILGTLKQLGHRDPETLGLYARMQYDRYRESGERIDLERSREYYATAFELAPTDFYTGINAAAKSVLLSEFETGSHFARQVKALVGAEFRNDADYWTNATIAEVHLIEGNFEQAARTYKRAILQARGQERDHQATWTQAKALLEALKVPDEHRRGIADAFSHLGR